MTGTLRRPDWLGELQTALIVALAAVGAFIALSVGAALDGPLAVTVPTGAVVGLTAAGGAPVDPAGTVDVLLPHPSPGQVLAGVLAGSPTFLVILVLFALLLGVVRQARAGGPFDRQVVRRLRLIAVLAIGAGVAAQLVEFGAQLTLTSAAVTDGSVSASLSPAGLLAWVLVGTALFAIAEVVNRGLALRTELDTVI